MKMSSEPPSQAGSPLRDAPSILNPKRGRLIERADKRLSLKEAIAEYVQDGLSVAIEGFTSFICFAAGHEIIRQGRRDLTLIRMTPDALYDQMIASGAAR